MKVKIKTNTSQIKAKITAGSDRAVYAITEAVIEYGNMYVREDQGVLLATSLIGTSLPDTVSRKDWTNEDQKVYASASGSDPKKGFAVWDTPYAKKMYYTGTPSKDVNPQASLMWAEKGVKTHQKELNQIAQNAFTKGMSKK